ncbi:AHH domain-containing protein [Xanthobacter agilis]|uniref:AHH domain-containing protein n=1 Tax=Xanthobacter agilis TaxID=47492 RepID=UPI003729D5CE
MGKFPFSNRPKVSGQYQAHHIITQYVIQSIEVLYYMFHNYVIDTKDFHAGNGLLLPSESALAERQGLPLHNGSHPWLGDLQLKSFANAELADLFNAEVYNNINRGMSRDEAERAAALEVRGLVLGMQDRFRLGVSPVFDANGELVDLNGQ